MLDRAGTGRRISARSGISASATAYPSGTAQVGAIAVPTAAKGSITHVLINATATGGAPPVIGSLFGYSAELDRWYVLDQLNGGATITPSTKTGAADGNNTHYAETFSHISMWDKLFVILTTIAGTDQSVAVDYIFEEP